MDDQERDLLLPRAQKRSKRWTYFGVCGALVVLLIGLLCYLLTTRNTEVISTKLGQLRGVKLQSRAGQDFYGFYNVPYALPPVGPLRFEPPQPSEPWTEVRDATVMGPDCAQVPEHETLPTGSEDCLYVNVFTPRFSEREKKSGLPVIFFVFGGNFIRDSANQYFPDYFMDEDVIMVIVQYRLSVFGWLNTGDHVVTGNQALKDLVMALSWVQENIRSFGGDPSRVTLCGQCGGAVLVNDLLLSPMSVGKGLFIGAIAMSGGALSRFMTNPRSNAVAVGKYLNCADQKESTELVDCFRAASAMDLALYGNTINYWGPSLERIPEDGNLTGVFFPVSPLALMLSGNGSRVPLLLGDVSDEQVYTACPDIVDNSTRSEVNNDWDHFIHNFLGIQTNSPAEFRNISQALRNFYMGNTSLSTDNWRNFSDMCGDRIFVHPSKVGAVFHARKSPTYLYYFSKVIPPLDPAFTSCMEQLSPPHGVSNSEEVKLFMPWMKFADYIPLESEYANFSQEAVKLWANFARTGAPGTFYGVPWSPIDVEDNGKFWFHLDDVSPGLVQPFTARFQLWDSLHFDVLYNLTTVTAPY